MCGKSAEIRKQMKKLRQERSFDAEGHFLLGKSAAVIRERLEEVLQGNNRLRRVLCFYPIGSEVPLLPLYKKIIASHSLYFPVTGERDLSFYRVSSMEKGAFAEGKMRIPEPVGRGDKYERNLKNNGESVGNRSYGNEFHYERDGVEKEKIQKTELVFLNSEGEKCEKIYNTAAIVPGLAFSAKNIGRIGYGGGYYDRFLAENPDILKIGVCYEFQMVDDLPQNPWDEPMDCIVTDERIVR